jgi:hypothetical protein
MTKIILIIFSCKKYESRIKMMEDNLYFDFIKEGNRNIDFYIVKGDPQLNVEYEINDHFMNIKCEDTYEEFPSKVLKTISIITSLYKNDNYVFIKSDDDCILNINKLCDNIDYIKSNGYVGSLNNFPGKYNPTWNGLHNTTLYRGPYMNGSPGYGLSKKSCEFISDYIKTDSDNIIPNEKFEDKLIGDILRLNKEIIFKKHSLWKNRPAFRNDLYQEFKNGSTDIICMFNITCIVSQNYLKSIDILMENLERFENFSQN